MADQSPPGERPAAARPTRRRQFPALYKLRILARYDQLDRAGRSALLRREGLRASLVSQWRLQRDAAALEAMEAEPGGQPVYKIHASTGLREGFEAVAGELGYTGGQLLRIVMRYYTGISDVLPPRPADQPPSPAAAGAHQPGAPEPAE